MKKNKLKKFILILLLFTFNLYINNTIYANDNVFETKSDAIISVIDDSGATEPVNPLNPSEPDNGKNADNNKTNNTGNLTLDVVPKAFKFGESHTSNDAMKINAISSGNSDLQYLQVTDKRTNEDGWELNVSQTREFTSDDGKVVLKGANITIPKGNPRNSLMDNPASTNNTGLFTEAVNTSINVDQTIFSSPNNYDLGKGTSTNTWDLNNVCLNIPKFSAKKGNFSSELKWSLVAGVE